MLDYSFLEILESLTRDELKSFRRFILSPYFNRSKKVVRLYDALVKYYPNFDNPSITKQKLHSAVNPELPYNEITMRRLLFDLQNLSEKYIRQQFIEKKGIEARLNALEELANRGTGKMHRKTVKDTEKMITETEYFNSDLCHNRFRLETEQFYFGMIKDKINRKKFVDTEASRLISGITYLISYFMLEAIKHNDTLLTYSRSFNVKYNEKFISQFINLFDFERLAIFMRSNSIEGEYVINVYLNALKAFLYFDNEQYYNSFKDILYENRDKLTSTDNHFLYFRLVSYCITKTQNSEFFNSRFEHEIFSIYKSILEHKYYKTETNKYLPVDLFRNIVIQSIRLKEHGWLENFVTSYGSQLHPDRKKDIINYSYAMLYFERNAFDESLAYLSRVKMEEFSYQLDIRNLYIKIYYDLEDYEAAQANIRSLRKYVTENSLISKQNRTYQENFAKYTQKLINYHNSVTKTDLTSLKLQIGRTNKVTSKDWLIDRIQSLDKSVKRAV